MAKAAVDSAAVNVEGDLVVVIAAIDVVDSAEEIVATDKVVSEAVNEKEVLVIKKMEKKPVAMLKSAKDTYQKSKTTRKLVYFTILKLVSILPNKTRSHPT